MYLSDPVGVYKYRIEFGVMEDKTTQSSTAIFYSRDSFLSYIMLGNGQESCA
jgi:hypothetical protein